MMRGMIEYLLKYEYNVCKLIILLNTITAQSNKRRKVNTRNLQNTVEESNADSFSRVIASEYENNRSDSEYNLGMLHTHKNFILPDIFPSPSEHPRSHVNYRTVQRPRALAYTT